MRKQPRTTSSYHARDEIPKRTIPRAWHPRPKRNPYVDLVRDEDTLFDVERTFLTRLCATGDWNPVLKHKLTHKHFSGPQAPEMFRWLEKSFGQYGRVPSVKHFYETWKNLDDDYDTGDDPMLLGDVIRGNRLSAELLAICNDVVKSQEQESPADPDQLMELVSRRISKLTADTAKSSVVFARDMQTAILADYAECGDKDGLLGHEYPWPSITKETRGMRPNQVICLYGPEGTMKTFLALAMADHVHAKGKKILFVTMEMPARDIIRRLSAMRAKVDWSRYQDAQLTDYEHLRWRKRLKELAHEEAFAVLQLEETGQQALALLRAKMQELKPDLVVIDGMVLFAGTFKWDEFEGLMVGIKSTALSTSQNPNNASILVTHHSNAAGTDLDAMGSEDVAVGKAIMRHVDVQLRIELDKGDKRKKQLKIWIKKVREGQNCGVLLNARPVFDFQEKTMFRSMDELNEFEAKEAKAPLVSPEVKLARRQIMAEENYKNRLARYKAGELKDKPLPPAEDPKYADIFRAPKGKRKAS